MTKSPSFYQVVYQVQGELQSKGIKPIKESFTMALDKANSALESDLKLCQIIWLGWDWIGRRGLG